MNESEARVYIKRYTMLLRGEGLSSTAIYCAVLEEFEGTPYQLGTDTVLRSDCSGSVSTAMSAALGMSIRVSADVLYKNWFTRTEAAPGIDEKRIYAAFFLDETGKAIHTCGWCGDCFINVSEKEKNGGARRSVQELSRMYAHLKMRIRSMQP